MIGGILDRHFRRAEDTFSVRPLEKRAALEGCGSPK
jgi:hypothetical protein